MVASLRVGTAVEPVGLVAPVLGELSAPSARYPNLYWLRIPHGGKARALNAAIGVMTTETVMTVDADTLLAADATRAMRAAFAANPRLVAATGGHDLPVALVEDAIAIVGGFAVVALASVI